MMWEIGGYINPDTRTVINLSAIRWDGAREPNVYELNRVNTPYQFRGQGFARELMARMLRDADDHQAIVWCWIAPSGSMNYLELAAWYMRLGFEPVRVLDSDRSFLATIYCRWPQPNVRSLRVSDDAWYDFLLSERLEPSGWKFT